MKRIDENTERILEIERDLQSGMTALDIMRKYGSEEHPDIVGESTYDDECEAPIIYSTSGLRVNNSRGRIHSYSAYITANSDLKNPLTLVLAESEERQPRASSRGSRNENEHRRRHRSSSRDSYNTADEYIQ